MAVGWMEDPADSSWSLNHIPCRSNFNGSVVLWATSSNLHWISQYKEQDRCIKIGLLMYGEGSSNKHSYQAWTVSCKFPILCRYFLSSAITKICLITGHHDKSLTLKLTISGLHTPQLSQKNRDIHFFLREHGGYFGRHGLMWFRGALSPPKTQSHIFWGTMPEKKLLGGPKMHFLGAVSPKVLSLGLQSRAGHMNHVGVRPRNMVFSFFLTSCWRVWGCWHNI